MKQPAAQVAQAEKSGAPADRTDCAGCDEEVEPGFLDNPRTTGKPIPEGPRTSAPGPPMSDLHDWNSNEFLGFNLKLLGKKTKKNVLVSAGKMSDKEKK